MPVMNTPLTIYRNITECGIKQQTINDPLDLEDCFVVGPINLLDTCLVGHYDGKYGTPKSQKVEKLGFTVVN